MYFILFFSLLAISIESFAATDCEDNWIPFSNGRFCLYFDGNKVSYQQARNFCAAMRKDADLAILDDANMLREIYKYIMEYDFADDSYWLGGSDLEFEGDWKWLDGSRIDYGTPFWATNKGVFGWSQEPSGGSEENCLVLDKDRLFYMDDRNCFNNNHPLCMYSNE